MSPTETPLLPSITSRIWDVIVIGAGPAGAVAAHQFVRQGLHTLLVERQAWPRAKVCGGCLNGQALSVLKTIGLERILEDSQAAPLTQLIVQSRHRSAKVELPGGAAVNRSQFDAALVKAAVEAGAEFLPGTKVVVAPQAESSQFRHVSLSRGSENGLITKGRIVVAADGLGHPSLKELPEFSSHISDGARIGISIVIDTMPPTYRAGAIYMAVSRRGYVGLVRTRNSCGNLAAAIDFNALKSAEDPAQVVRSILEDSGLPSPTFSESAVWRGTIPLMRRSNRLSAHRLFLLGDAAGYAEPFTGEGIGWAMSSAVALKPVAMSNLDRWNANSIGQWETLQKKQLQRGQIVSRTLAYLLRKPMAVHFAIRALRTIPSLARPLVRRVYQT